MKQLLFLVSLLLIIGCKDDGMPDNPNPSDSSPNILLIIADDLGKIFGIDYYAGLVRGEAQSYSNWQLTEDTQSNFESEYTTTKFTDLAIDWISQQEKPWFMWLAYNG